MTHADAEEFGSILATVAEFYDRKLSDALIVMFFRSLEAYDIEIVNHAFNRFLQSSESKHGFPKPAQIRDIIEGSDSERDALAWVTLETAVRRVGIHSSVIVEDSALAQAIRMTFGGWWQACSVKYNDPIGWNSKRKDFAAMYSIARRQPNSGPVLLAGRCDSENSITGWHPKRSSFGAILLDGRVESRYLSLDTATGLPAVSLREALALPEPTVERKALPEHENVTPISEDQFREQLSEHIRRRSIRETRQIAPLTAAADDERMKVLQQQARVINADSSAQTIKSVHAEEIFRAESDGSHDRVADVGGGTAEVDAGVQIRGGDRPELARGSRVAGVEDPVRDRGRRVRKPDSLRAGKLENGKGSKGRTQRLGTSKTRRKA